MRRRLGDEFLRREAHRVQSAIGMAWMRLRNRYQHQIQQLDPTRLRSLLVVILRNLLIDEHLHQSSHDQLEDEMEGVVDTVAEVDAHLRDDMLDLEDCLRRMPESHRQAYDLLYIRKLTLAEAAKQMGLAGASGASAHREAMLAWLRNCMNRNTELE